MIFLDANVFIYAAGATHPRQPASSALLRRTASGEIRATTNTEVLQELLHILSRRGRPTEAIALVNRLLKMFPDVLPVRHQEMALACDLLRRYPRLSSRDAVHAATMLHNGIKHIVSADPDFDQIAEIRRIDPQAV